MWVKTTKWVTVDDLCGELWSGARNRWINATDEQREEAFSRLEEYFYQACADDGEENAVEMVTVNDELWFDMDDIWDGKEEDETDDEEDDEDGDNDGNFFCSRECAIRYNLKAEETAKQEETEQ